MSRRTVRRVLGASVFGFCATGAHEPRCPGEYRPFFFEGKRLIHRDEVRVCGCPCHEHDDEEENPSA